MALDKSAYFKELTIPQLKKENAENIVTISSKSQQIKEELQAIRTQSKLPQKVIKQYEQEFGSIYSKKSLKGPAVLILIAILIAIFAQPSVLIFSEGNKIAITNFSKRTVEEVSVKSIETILNQEAVFYTPSLETYGTQYTSDLKPGIYLSFAKNQLPWIAAVIPKLSTDTGSDFNPIYRTLKRMIGG